MSLKIIKKPKLVKITWEDASLSTDHAWSTVDGFRQWIKDAGTTCFTVGWLIARSKTMLYGCATLSSDGEDFGNCWAIPRGCVRGMEVLKIID